MDTPRATSAAYASALKILSRRILSAAKGGDEKCPVCLEELRSVRCVTLVPCAHMMCSLCEAMVSECPLCRTEVKKVVTIGDIGHAHKQRFRTFWGPSQSARDFG